MRRIVALLVVLAALSAPAGAFAHPLGNFTINRFASVEASGDALYVRYVLDLAEIPTFQDGDRVRAPGFAAQVARHLELRVDGRRIGLTPLAHRARSRPGAGGLSTLRFEAVYAAARGGSTVSLRDENYASRIGWREIVVRARDGARVVSASVPSTSSSRGLLAYPKELLRSPLDVHEAAATIEPGGGEGCRPSSPARPRRSTRAGASRR